MLDADLRGAVDLDALAPLHHDCALLRELVEAEVRELGDVFDPVEVDVRELDAAGIDANELERGARDPRLGPGATRDAADKRRFARAELTAEQDDVAGLQTLAETLAGELGLGR